MPGAPAAAARCQGLPSIDWGMQGELQGGPGSGTIPVLWRLKVRIPIQSPGLIPLLLLKNF